MKKQSIISSLTAAAVILPALNHASPIVNQTDTKSQQDAKKVNIPDAKPPVDISNATQQLDTIPPENGPSSLCVAPYVQKMLDSKTVQVFTVNGAIGPVVDPEMNAPTATAVTTNPTDETVATTVNGATAMDETVATTVDGTTATDETVATTVDGTTAATTTDAATPGYDRHAIFGADSKIFTRITNPVKNFFADVMFAQTTVRHHNQQYNLVPTTPDPMIRAKTINAYFEIPFDNKIDIKASIGRDAVTSASPVFYTITGASPGVVAPVTGNAQQAVTGASIHDQRNEGDITISYYGEKATTKFEVGGSSEFDYNSSFLGGEVDIDFNNKNSSINIGASNTYNDLTPDQLGAITPRVGGTNTNFQALLGMTQIIDNQSLAQFAVTYFYDKGYMNDPYKPDFLPNTRRGVALAGKYLHYFPTFHEAGLNIDYRYYTDNWGVRSSTLKSTLRLDLVNGWGVEPGIRYYSQTGTKYYNLLLPPNVTPQSTFVFYTSDYRFASYGQVSGLLEVDKQLTATNTFYIGGSYGVRRADLRLGGTKVTYPTEPRFTKIQISVIYLGIKGLY